jgi:hypothetical protein
MDPEAADAARTADWRVDPTGRHQYRLWDGEWTNRVSDFGVRSEDPYTGSVAPPLGFNPARLMPPTPTTSAYTPRSLDGTRHRGPTSSRAKTIGGVALLVGSLLAAVGTQLPALDHYNADDISYMDLPGRFGANGLWVALIAIVLALIALLGVLRQQSSRTPTFVALLVGISLLVVAFRDWRTVDNVLTDARLPGLGLWSGLTLCVIGAVVAVAGAVTALVAQRR